jgi:hypothetical protein
MMEIPSAHVCNGKMRADETHLGIRRGSIKKNDEEVN